MVPCFPSVIPRTAFLGRTEIVGWAVPTCDSPGCNGTTVVGRRTAQTGLNIGIDHTIAMLGVVKRLGYSEYVLHEGGSLFYSVSL